jgi:hypothetical protein
MSHTQGKLEVLDGKRLSITLPSLVEGCGYDSHCIALTYGGDERIDAKANARRIKACWNASIGIPTAELEAAADGRLLNIFEGLISERDELLAALKQVIGVIDAAGLHNLSNGVQLGQTVWYVKASDAKDAARAAIERAEKGGA